MSSKRNVLITSMAAAGLLTACRLVQPSRRFRPGGVESMPCNETPT